MRPAAAGPGGPGARTVAGCGWSGSRPTSWTCPARVGCSARPPAAPPKGDVEWLEARGDQWKAQVQVVVIDMCSPYRSAVQQALPEARLVADRFHLVRLANEMVTDVRQRVFREQRHRRGRAVDPAWANRRLLLRAGDQLSDRALSRLTATFAADDPTGEIGAAWGVKERLRMLLATSDRHSSAEALRFHQTVLAAELPEATRLAHTLDAWWPQILGFLLTRHTNAGTEAHQPHDQRRRTDRLRVPQPRPPTPPSTVPLHSAITSRRQCPRVHSPSTLKSRQSPVADRAGPARP